MGRNFEGKVLKGEYFAYDNYLTMRRQKPFGSSGQEAYVRVTYHNKRDGKELSVKDIAGLLKKGGKVILEGASGTGKSRCVREVFEILSGAAQAHYVISVNLREHGGAKRAQEILARHFEDLGIEVDKVLKSFDSSHFVYLLDGFDEMEQKSWNRDMQSMRYIRANSVQALRDMVDRAQGGILITGREYFFNSDEEMLSCLGLDEKQAVLLECHLEFTEMEALEFVSRNMPEISENKKLELLPVWFPRSPLSIRLLQEYGEDVCSVKHSLDNICSFWHALLEKICEREAGMHPELSPEVIKEVLFYLADMTRDCVDGVGPITRTDFSEAFTKATGAVPDAGMIELLQGLPSLGKISETSPDRQFTDRFILDGLRAESIIQLSLVWTPEVFQKEWKHPLNQTGQSILAEYIEKKEDGKATFLYLARNASLGKNQVLASDIVAAVSMFSVEVMDFQNMSVDGGHFSSLSFAGKKIRHLIISDSMIERMDLTDGRMADSVKFRNCYISTVNGISPDSVPPQLQECEVKQVERLAMATPLMERARLSVSQKILVSMIRKIFIQPGGEHRESMLLRGRGGPARKKLRQDILVMLKEEKLVTEIRENGAVEAIYEPASGATERMNKMLTELTVSKDSLWLKVSEVIL